MKLTPLCYAAYAVVALPPIILVAYVIRPSGWITATVTGLSIWLGLTVAPKIERRIKRSR